MEVLSALALVELSMAFAGLSVVCRVSSGGVYLRQRDAEANAETSIFL